MPNPQNVSCPTQIYADEWATDSRFFIELKRTYLKYPGWLGSWFSMNRMGRRYSDLPVQKEYKCTRWKLNTILW